MKKHFLFIIILFSFGNLFAQSVAHTRCASFEKGMNLSNWLEAAWQQDWPTETGYAKSDLQSMKDAGIKSIRLPINFAAISDTVYPFNVDTAHPLFQRIDTVIKWTGELQMNLIIDNHHGWELTNDNWRSYKDRFARMWGVVAKKYQNLDPEHYFFELLNEPPIAFNDMDSLNLLFYTAIDSIRNYTTSHSIVVSPPLGSWGMAFNIYQPLTDTNLIYTLHSYDPIDFTHQGFAWHDPYYPAGIVFPSANSFYEQFIYEGWHRVANWLAVYNKPLFLGEFGVGEHADDQSRCNWIEFEGHKIDSLNIPWFYWDWRWDFSMFNSHTVSGDSIIDCFSHALHLYGDSLSGVEENPADDVIIFPNPVESSGGFSIEVKNANGFNLTVYDGFGRIVLHETIKGSKSILLKTLESGYYTVEILQNNKRFYRKLIVS